MRRKIILAFLGVKWLSILIFFCSASQRDEILSNLKMMTLSTAKDAATEAAIRAATENKKID